MRGSCTQSPWLRALVLACVVYGGSRVLPACETAPTGTAPCLGVQVVSGSDFACVLMQPRVVCPPESADAGPGGSGDAGATRQGCFLGGREMRCWGSSRYGATNPALRSFVSEGAPRGADGGVVAPAILALGQGSGNAAPCAVIYPGTVRCENTALGERGVMPGITNADQVVSGPRHVCARLATGEVRCLGASMLLPPDFWSSPTPFAVPTREGDLRPLSGVTQLVGGSDHACALLEGGEVRCWGFNEQGRVTSARVSATYYPVTVSGLGGRAVQIAAGDAHSCAIVELAGVGDAGARREVRCWGSNQSGQLGNPAPGNGPVPVLAPSGAGNLDNVVSIAAGRDHTCAVTGDQKVYCWGANGDGQVGVMPSPTVSRPVEVTAAEGALMLSAGDGHTCALVASTDPGAAAQGRPVRCWGRMGDVAASPPDNLGALGPALSCCVPTPTNRSGACVDLQRDAANCGATGNRCASGQVCVSGQCRCGSNTATCGGACVDTQRDVQHCGACGNACPGAGSDGGAVTCQRGRCEIACGAGTANCDTNLANGCETNTQTAAAHCGACGNACTVTNGVAACRQGACAVQMCNVNFGDCDNDPSNGCETDLRTSATHCGRCGNTCGGSAATTTAACVSGMCGMSTCRMGFQDCNNNPSDGCETPTGQPCAAPPTGLPPGSRYGAGRHVVNIVTCAPIEAQLAGFLGSGGDLSAATTEFFKYFRDEYDFVTIVPTRDLNGGACRSNTDCLPGRTCQSDGRGGMVCRVGSAATFTPVNRPRMPGAMAPCPAGVTPCRTGERNQAAYRAGAPNRFRGVFGANVSSTSSSPPNLHELAHYWGVELPNTLFGRGYSGHWGVSSVRGALGGFDPATARCASGQALSTCVSGPGGGSVTLNLPQGAISDACRMQTGRTGLPWGDVWAPGDTVGYAPLELYLMGLVGRAEAGGPWYVLDGAGQTGATTWSGSRLRQVTIDDIVRETGAERTPLPMNERAFRTAVVVFSTTPVSDAWLANLERWSAILGNDATDPCLLSFQRATGDRATMSTVLGAQRVPGMPSGTAPTCPGGAP